MTTENSPTSLEQLLEYVKSGRRIPEESLRAIRSELAAGCPQGEAYTRLHILGKAGAKDCADLVKSYLEFGEPHSEDDAMVRRIAIQVLGRMWELPEAFPLATEKAFKDPSPLVRAAAATIIGFLGARNSEFKKTAALLLLKGLDDSDRQEVEVWESFYIGLLELFEVPPVEWPLATRELKTEDLNLDLLNQARQLAEAADR